MIRFIHLNRLEHVYSQQIPYTICHITSGVLTHGHPGQLPGGLTLIYVCCAKHVFNV